MLLMIAVSLSAAAQRKVTGTVIDETGEPLIGATVMVVGDKTGVVTDVNGQFVLPAVKSNKIKISYVGYRTMDVDIKGKSDVQVSLIPNENVLDEVVVIGYGTQKRSDLTGSIASVSAKDVEGYKSSTVVEALSGKVAGVQIAATDGTPGAGFDIKIRGVGSVNGDTSPLFIVDGFQVDNIDYLANSDIESVEMLKDASASAIYGSRAANGVVLVTTKSGKVGRPVVSYNGSVSTRRISKTLDLLTPYQFAMLQVEAWPDRFSSTYWNEGNDAEGNPYRFQTAEDLLSDPGVDWQSETFRPTWSTDHNLSIAGGNERTKYTFSVSDFIENGIFRNSAFNKITAKMRVNHKVTDRVTMDATVNYAFTDKRGMGTSSDNGRFNMLAQILRARPTAGLRMTNEELLGAAIDPLELESSESLAQVNPIKQAESVTNTTKTDLWNANLSLTFDLGKGLTLRVAGTYNNTTQRLYQFYHDGSKEAYRNGQKPYGSNRYTRSLRWSNSNTLTYKFKRRRGHAFDVMIGQETSAQNSEHVLAASTDFPFDNLGNNNLGIGATPTQAASGRSEKTLVSFFARGNYNYRDRYMVTATMRADGSTAFSKKHKWGYFPSFSAAWRINQEDFLKDVTALTNLKLRAGWGRVGNDRITNYLSLDLYSQGKYGYGNNVITVLNPKQLANYDLRWEASESTNIGVDVGVLNNRLTATADIFVKDTHDLLMAANKAYVSGFASQWQNVGKIRNSGIELTINSVNLDNPRGLRWTTAFNISFIKNELKQLADGAMDMYTAASWNSDYTGYDYMASVGHSLGLIYGYMFDGVYQQSDFNVNASTGAMTLKPGVTDISEHAGRTVVPGMVKYKDMNGDGIITPEDRTVIGNGTPKWFGGLTNTFEFFGVDLSFMFQFSYGNQVYNATRMYASQTQDQRSNLMAETADRWTVSNASNSVPAWDGYVKNELYSRFVEDGSFLRLKNITLGYTFPSRWTRKFYVSNLRVYGTAQNVFCVSNYKGYDPEVNMRSSNPMTPSFDWGAYPRSRVFTFGLDIKF